MNNQILNKIRNNNYKFTNYEMHYIRDYSLLKIDILIQLNENNKSWNEDLYNMLTECIELEVISQFENVIYNYLNYQIEFDNFPRSNTLENINYITDINKRTILLDKYNNKLKDINYLKENSFEEADILYLLNNKEYLLISNIGNIFTYNRPSLDFITKFHKEYPFEKYKYPKFLFEFHDHIFLKYIDYLDIESLFIALTEPQLTTKNIDDIKKAIYRKLDSDENYENESFNFLLKEEKYYLFKQKLSSKELKYIAYKLLEKNSILLYEYLQHDEIVTRKVDKVLKKSYEQNMLFTYNDERTIVLNNGIISSLAKSGRYKFLLNLYHEQNNPSIRLNIYNEIKNILINNPEVFKDNLDVISTGDIPSKEILDLILNTGYPTEIYITRDNEYYYKSIIKYVDKYPSVILNFNDLSSKDLKTYFRLSLVTENIELLYDLIRNNHLTSYFYEILCEYLNNNKILNLIGNSLLDIVLKEDILLNYFLDHNLYIFELISYAQTDELYDDFFSEKNYQKIKEHVANHYNIYTKNLDILEKACGPNILRYLDSDSIINILQLKETNVSQIIELFNYDAYNIIDVEAIYDAIKQYNFSVENPIIFNIGELLANNDYLAKEDILKYLDNNFINRINNKYQINCSNNIILLEQTIDKFSEDKNYLNILHDIIDYYILKKREEYRLKYKDKIYEEINIPYEYDRKKVINQGAIYALENYDSISLSYNRFINLLYDKLSINKDDLISMLKEYNNGSLSSEDIKLLKRNTKEIINENYLYFYKHYINKIESKLKKEYYVPDNDPNILEILNHLNVDKINTIINNEDQYNCLKNIMKTKKLASLPNFIKDFLKNQNNDINYNENDEINFINYFSNIYTHEKSNNPNLNLSYPTIFKYGSLYNGLSNIYTQILGQEDAELISLNPGQLRAHFKTERNERLNIACNLTVNNFLRQEVIVPTFNDVFTYKGNNIRVIVGNFTAPYNLTHGERTDSCMRIGGYGETLYEYALKSKNAFHITLLDADNDTYLTRATCFRNGNSMFVNGLRHSLNYSKYNDRTIAEILRKVSKKIIELSSNSKYPIDNVFAFDGYAIVELSLSRVNLGVPSIKKNMEGFYSDIGSSAVVLATRSKEKEFVPLTFGTNYDIYLPARIKTINSSSLHEVYNMLNRVNIINKLIKLKKINPNEDVMNMGVYLEPLNVSDGLIECYVNYDYYVYIDNDYNIHDECIGIDPRSIEELNYYKDILKKKYIKERVK